MASIDGIIGAQAARAENYAGTAENEMRAALAAASSLATVNKPTILWDFSANDKPTTQKQSITATFTLPNKPGAFDKSELQYINPIQALSVGALPDIDIGSLFQYPIPEVGTPDFTEAAPSISFDDIEDALAAIQVPVINDVALPTLSAIAIGAMPDVTVPTFSPSTVVVDPGEAVDAATAFQAAYEEALPVIKAFVDDAVSNYESTYAPGYRNALSTLESKIQNVFDNGSILDENYEANVYARARARAELEATRAINEIESNHKKRGFLLPPASMMSGIAQTVQNTVSNLSTQATDIAIKRAELEIQQAQFALTTSAQLRESMRNAFLQYAQIMAQINQQADEHAKAVASFMLDAYKANLERMARLTDLLRTEAAIYETYLKASLAQLDIYKLELEAAKLNVDIDALQVDVFAKQIMAEQSRIEMYVALLKSVESRANIEKSKIEVYAENVKAYVARLTSDELKNKIYIAALQGDELKMKGQLAKLDAYIKGVEGESARVKASVDIESLKSTQNKLLIDVYRNDLDAWKAEIGAEETRFEGDLKAQMAVIDTYIKNLQAKLDIYRTEFDINKMYLDKAELQAKIDTDVAIKNADIFMSRASLQANIAKDIGNIYATMAGSALSSQNTMVSQAAEG